MTNVIVISIISLFIIINITIAFIAILRNKDSIYQKIIVNYRQDLVNRDEMIAGLINMPNPTRPALLRPSANDDSDGEHDGYKPDEILAAYEQQKRAASA